MYILLREPFLNIPGLFYALTIDALIVVFVALNVVRGYRIGVLRQLLGLMGFIVGMFFGVLLVPILVSASQDRLFRTTVTLMCVVGMGLFLGWAAEQIGKDIKALNWRHRQRVVGQTLGGVMAGAIALGLIWLTSSMFVNSSLAPLAAGLQRSFVLRTLSAVLPPAPTFMTHVQAVIDPNAVPQVFVGLEPWPSAPLDAATSSDVANASSAQGPSVVQIEALGCGSIYGGSGFVVAPNMVVTNAHVVAGVRFPVILDPHGAHATAIVLFDPVNDIAILRTSNLHGKPLALSSVDSKRGDKVTVIGYPDNGPYRAVPGVVLESEHSRGRDIYDDQEVLRHTYTVQADVRPGSSGSPLIQPDGSVAGMIYGHSLLADGIGYALSASQIAIELGGISASSPTVSTGRCTNEK